MPVIKPTCVRDLKLRVNLADVVARMVTLRKAGGARLKGLCPFHNEKTPSFNVDPDKGYYHCFGCGKSGDIISFVRETEQLNFSEAVEALGKRFGIPIEYEEGSGGPSTADRTLRQEVFDLHDAAAEHYFKPSRRKTRPVMPCATCGSSNAVSPPNSPTSLRLAPPMRPAAGSVQR